MPETPEEAGGFAGCGDPHHRTVLYLFCNGARLQSCRQFFLQPLWITVKTSLRIKIETTRHTSYPIAFRSPETRNQDRIEAYDSREQDTDKPGQRATQPEQQVHKRSRVCAL